MQLALTLASSLESEADQPCEAEARLVAASRDRDPDAFARLVHLHQRRVFRLAGRFFRRREDVEDVAQDTFLAAWNKLHTYRASAPFEHWLTRVCLNCCYGRLRRRTVVELPFEGDRIAPEGDPDRALDAHRLLACLRPVDRFLLLLLCGEGWSVAQIADRLGWSRANVRVRVHRARARLRRLMEERAR